MSSTSLDTHLCIPVHREAFTIKQNSLINGPTSRPSLRACIAFWAIPVFNLTPLWMTINGVRDLNACPGSRGGGGGVGNCHP